MGFVGIIILPHIVAKTEDCVHKCGFSIDTALAERSTEDVYSGLTDNI